jgi:hypothetical protein
VPLAVSFAAVPSLSICKLDPTLQVVKGVFEENEANESGKGRERERERDKERERERERERDQGEQRRELTSLCARPL